MALSESQLLAITSLDRKILLVASAGSGKTSVLIEKVKHLIIEKDISAKSVLMLTFSNKAANQLKERLLDKIGLDSREATISTFHAFALKIIKQFVEYTNLSSFFKIIDHEERNRYLATVANEVKVPRYLLKDYKENIEGYKTNFIPIPNHFLELHKRLNEKLKSMRMIEINDLIPIATKLIKENNQVLHYLQDKYQYILIDEYQDINQQQYNFIFPLINLAKQFIAVGDDDQCIYEWRGSKPELMRELSEKQDVRNIYLTQNYRSQKNIIEFSNRIINNNKTRIAKAMSSTKPPMSIPEFDIFKDRYEEAKNIAKKIKKIIQSTPTKLKEISILVRNDSQTPVIISELNNLNIPYINHNSKIMLTKWFLEYMKEISSNAPNISKLINYPKIIIDKFKYEELCIQNQLEQENHNEIIAQIYDMNLDFTDALIFRSRYETASNLIEMKSTATILEIIDALYENILNSGDHLNENEVIYFNIAMSVARDYINLNENPTLEGYCDYFELIIDEITKNADEGVQVMTIHKAKGLEFDCVFIPGIDAENFPNPYFVTNDFHLEAERRLLYVGITRAKEHLFLSSGNALALDNRLLDGFATEIRTALSNASLYKNQQKDIKPTDVAESIINNFEQKVFSEVSKNQIEKFQFRNITNRALSNWINKEYPMLSREIQSICENTESILSDISRLLEPSRTSLLNNRSFLYGTLKLIFDEVIGGKAGKVTDYLRFNSVYQGFDLLKLHKNLIKTGKTVKPYSDIDLKRLVEYKNYLDALHHQFEPTKRKNTNIIIKDFKNKDQEEKIALLLSPIVFLNYTTLSNISLHKIESILRG